MQKFLLVRRWVFGAFVLLLALAWTSAANASTAPASRAGAIAVSAVSADAAHPGHAAADATIDSSPCHDSASQPPSDPFDLDEDEDDDDEGCRERSPIDSHQFALAFDLHHSLGAEDTLNPDQFAFANQFLADSVRRM